jgi:hypothetical protein
VKWILDELALLAKDDNRKKERKQELIYKKNFEKSNIPEAEMVTHLRTRSHVLWRRYQGE